MDRRRLLGMLEALATLELARKAEAQTARRVAMADPADAADRRRWVRYLSDLERILTRRAHELGWDGTPIERLEAEDAAWSVTDSTPTVNIRIPDAAIRKR